MILDGSFRECLDVRVLKDIILNNAIRLDVLKKNVAEEECEKERRSLSYFMTHDFNVHFIKYVIFFFFHLKPIGYLLFACINYFNTCCGGGDSAIT